MNWKAFKRGYENKNSDMVMDETKFILGIDFGDAATSFAYYDIYAMQPQIIDISGGYGKPSVPTVVQYINDTNEWVIGEYAVLNQGTGGELTFNSLLKKVVSKEYVLLNDKLVNAVSLLGIFIKELLANVRSINPNGEIIGIIAASSVYLNEESVNELVKAFAAAGYEKELIGFVSDTECAMARYLHDKKSENGRIMFLDYGSRGMRGSVIDIGRVSNTAGETVQAKVLSSFFDEEVAIENIDADIEELLCGYLCDELKLHRSRLDDKLLKQLDTFVYQHKDLILQKSHDKNEDRFNALKLYFNFVYPPFQRKLSGVEQSGIISKYAVSIKKFIANLMKSNFYTGDEIGTVDEVVGFGGGFEMTWAKQLVHTILFKSKIHTNKSAKGYVAEGACLVAAQRLGVIGGAKIMIEDKHRIPFDIGLLVVSNKTEKFIPVIERNSFWWQKPITRRLILSGRAVDQDKQKTKSAVGIYKRSTTGDVARIDELLLADFPDKPEGTSRILLSMRMASFQEMVVNISDEGFGEMVPKSEYSGEYIVKIS